MRWTPSHNSLRLKMAWEAGQENEEWADDDTMGYFDTGQDVWEVDFQADGTFDTFGEFGFGEVDAPSKPAFAIALRIQDKLKDALVSLCAGSISLWLTSLPAQEASRRTRRFGEMVNRAAFLPSLALCL
jgi:hypothetical protein